MWKQKEIAALKQFIKTNTPLEKDVSEKVEVVQNAEKGSRMVNDLQQKREMMTKATERRDDDFKKFMQDLQTFSSTPSATADEDTFKSGIQSYLKLIDEDTESNYQNVEVIRQTQYHQQQMQPQQQYHHQNMQQSRLLPTSSIAGDRNVQAVSRSKPVGTVAPNTHTTASPAQQRIIGRVYFLSVASLTHSVFILVLT